MSQEIYVKPKKVTPLNILLILIGSSLYALSVNFFLVPLKLYSGGVPGTAQMLRTLFFSNVQNVDTAGIINLAFNIPLFLLALKTMKKRMVVGTVLSVALQTISLHISSPLVLLSSTINLHVLSSLDYWVALDVD